MTHLNLTKRTRHADAAGGGATADRDATARRTRSASASVWRRPATIAALIVLAVAVVAALFPALLATDDPVSGTATPLAPPSAENWLGTDAVGRDLYSRIVFGARHSLSGAVIAVALGLVVGTLVGLLAGTRGGWVDAVLMRGVDVLLSVPSLLVSLSVIIILGFGTVNSAIAVGVSSVATFALSLIHI